MVTMMLKETWKMKSKNYFQILAVTIFIYVQFFLM